MASKRAGRGMITQGNLLLVQTFSTTLPVAPGAALPFGVSFGASVSTAIVPARATFQADLAGIFAPSPLAAVTLPAGVLDINQTPWELSFDAVMTNTSSQTLSGLDAIAAAYDKKGRLVAAEPISIPPTEGGALSPGEVFPLSFTMLLDGQAAPKS